MRTKTTISISEARRKIFDIAEEVQKPGVYYTFTDKGKPKAVMISAEYFESLIETIEVMEEFPDLKKDIEEVDRDIKSGAYKEYTTADALLADFGYVLADKSKKKYEVGRKVREESKKRISKNSRKR
jgi:prevent-host-death family protein